MHTKFRFGLMVLSVFVGVAAASASDFIRVKSSRHLRVVVIDASKPDATRASVHEAFTSSLMASIHRRGGSPWAVKLSEQKDVTNVAAALALGKLDAALVFENTVPPALAKSSFSSSRGVALVGVPVRVFHLVVRNDDADLMTLLNSAFSDTIKAPRFQEALSRSAAIRVVASTRG